MSDPFTLLGMERRPLPALESVTTTFQNLAAAAHPDGPQGDVALFTALNDARTTLLEPALRLRALIALESDGQIAATHAVPDALADAFASVSQALSNATDVIRRKENAPGALAKALIADEALTVQDQLQEILRQLADMEQQVQQALIHADQLWVNGQCALADLAQLADAFTYLQKWKSQVQEKLLLLIS